MCWTGALLGTIAIFIGDVSVLASGPLLSAAGVVELIWAARRGYRGVVLLGFLHLLICLLLFFLVDFFGWGPVQAQRPLEIFSSAYVVLTAVPTLAILRRPPSTHIPGICDSCGYLLNGLATPRCPECGQPFDPAELDSPASAN